MIYADKPWLKSYKLGPYNLEHSLAPFPEEPERIDHPIETRRRADGLERCGRCPID